MSPGSLALLPTLGCYIQETTNPSWASEALGWWRALGALSPAQSLPLLDAYLGLFRDFRVLGSFWRVGGGSMESTRMEKAPEEGGTGAGSGMARRAGRREPLHHAHLCFYKLKASVEHRRELKVGTVTCQKATSACCGDQAAQGGIQLCQGQSRKREHLERSRLCFVFPASARAAWWRSKGLNAEKTP